MANSSDNDKDKPALASGARREFLKYSLISAATLAAGAALWKMPDGFQGRPAGREILAVCNSSYHYFDDARIVITDPGTVQTLEVATGKISSIDLPFFGHTVTQNPLRPHQAVCFEKWGLRGALLDLDALSVKTFAAADKGNIFFGHSVFSPDGSMLVTSEDTYDSTDGQLVLRDAATMRVIGKKSSYGVNPHECRSPDQGKTIVVMNNGGKDSSGSITWVDWESGKLLNRIDMGQDIHSGYSHVGFSRDHWLCVGGVLKPVSHLIAFVSPDGRFLVPNLPPEIVGKMKGEALSIAFLGQTDLVAVTVAGANMIMIFNYKTQTLFGTLDLKGGKGIVEDLASTADRPALLVSSYLERGLMSASLPKQGEPAITQVQPHFGGNGSHLNRLFI